MIFARQFEALIEDALRELDRLTRLELERVGQNFLRWLDGLLPRMPCDTWLDEFNRFVANLAREQVFVTEQSRQALIAWINNANEAAKREARAHSTTRLEAEGDPTDERPSSNEPEYRDESNESDEPDSKPPPADRLAPRLKQLLREVLAQIEKLPPEQWLAEVRKLLDHVDLPPDIEAQILEYYAALDKLWR